MDPALRSTSEAGLGSTVEFLESHAGRSTVAQRKSFLLRIDPAVLDAVQRWASDDLRSLNGQIEFALRKALRDAGRAERARANQNAEEDSDGAKQTSE